MKHEIMMGSFDMLKYYLYTFQTIVSYHLIIGISDSKCMVQTLKFYVGLVNISFNGRTESFPFPFLSQGNFGEKPFPEFLKAFPDLESDWQNLSCYF